MPETLEGETGRRAKARVAGAAISTTAAACVVVVEAAHFLARSPGVVMVGDIPVSPSVLPALAVAFAGGAHLWGRARSPLAAALFWLVVPLGLIFALTGAGDRITSVVGLLLAAVDEEIVYRLAGPALVAVALTRAGVSPRSASTMGYVVATAAFVVLPGHTQQWSTLADAAPFVAYAALACVVVQRSGAVVAVGMVHGVMNAINIGRLTGGIGPEGSVVVAALLVVLVATHLPASAGRDADDDLLDLTRPELERRAVMA